jgi:hypothetical protein
MTLVLAAQVKSIKNVMGYRTIKIAIFTEGTILMHKSAEGLNRKEIVEQSRKEGIQREQASLQYESKNDVPVESYSVHDYNNYFPIGNAVNKIINWKKQGAIIYYLSSRRIKLEVQAIREVLKKFSFPDYKNLYFRLPGENYMDVIKKIMPDIFIEDDCESIGGKKETIFSNTRSELKEKIKLITVKEFGGIDYLFDKLE